MSRGNPHLNVRVEHTLLAQVADVAQRRGIDQSALVREALLAYLQPRTSPATDQPQATPQPTTTATAFLHSLDAATRTQLTEAMARFQSSAVDLVRAIVRQWAATMRDPRRWRVWRP
jgi:hypothetical protein